MNKLFRYFPTKSVFDSTTKAINGNNNSYLDGDTVVDGEPEIKWQDICFIENWSDTSYATTQKLYTHGHLYGCGDVDNTIVLTYALENNVHGLADALDVATTISALESRIQTLENQINQNS